MKCDCGFEFNNSGFRNFNCVIVNGNWVNICPTCGAMYDGRIRLSDEVTNQIKEAMKK